MSYCSPAGSPIIVSSIWNLRLLIPVFCFQHCLIKGGSLLSRERRFEISRERENSVSSVRRGGRLHVSPSWCWCFPLAVRARVFLSPSLLAVGVLLLPVLEPVEVVGFFLFSVVFLLQAVIFRCWPVKNGGCWRISGGVMFNVRSISLGWFFSNKNFPSAVAGLSWS